ncbi:GSCOCT00013114001.2-RA-CDS [Cotesia congregata]|uniref:Cc_ben.7_18.7 n=2 Tax=root TaxID=1 RepID=S6D9L4_COTCN|nr:hypothetical protein CcBV_18.7 [Bracoviriform congregatae]CAD6243710.1 GSCOCT00013114001.2-RA-CDS [Cotesia congregata]CAG17465.1 hypothetical protein CcBV_18.7 [Bracoviriform congregatae]CAG5092558.1 cc_ben.7_18.7 [Cotesia congregata]CCQ71277.1 hypothetical protein BEN-7 [Cotesia congregata]
MDESRKHYHMVKFVPAKIMGGSEIHCIPTSWITWKDKESTTVLVAYPNEPWEVTRERIKNYENHGKDWTVYWAKIIYSTDFYKSMIPCVNQREHGLEEFSSCKIIASKVGSPHCSYSAEFQKYFNRLLTVADTDCSKENVMEENPKVQSDSSGSAIVLDSDDDTPFDLSMRSSESRSTSERGDCTEDVCFPEVIIKEVGRSDSSSPLSASKFSGVNENNTFWSSIGKWFLNCSNTADPELSMASRIVEVPKLQHEVSSISIGQDSKDGSDGEVSRDWCVNSSKVDEQLGASSLLKDALTNPGGNDKRWTLKHPEYSPGLVELWPGTDVYIEVSKLNFCMRSSKKCTELTRLLTKHVFTEFALSKCKYINNVKGRENLRLDTGAVTAIIYFVSAYGYNHSWRPSNEKSIKAAMRYELISAKKKK